MAIVSEIYVIESLTLREGAIRRHWYRIVDVCDGFPREQMSKSQ